MRGLWSTLALIVVLAGLGAYIYFVDSQRPASTAVEGEPAREKFFAVETDKINEIRLTVKGQTTLLRKEGSGWKMMEPIAVDADPPEVIGLAQAISGIESVRQVVENPTDLAQFGLAEPQIQVEFKAEGGAAGSFKLGNKNPQQSEVYALKAGDNKVVLVSSFQESTFNKEPFALRDKRILKFDREQADSLAMVKGESGITLARTGSEWKVVKPVEARSDYSAIEGFLTRLSSANMSRLVEENPKDLAQYGLDKPVMTVTIGAGSSKTVLEVGKTENDQTYAKDASRPMVFTVDTTLQGDLNKSFDDYRKKDLFELRPFYTAKLRAVLDGPGGTKTYEFEKVPPAKEGTAESWKVTRVGGASHTADPAAMDDLLNKLVAIKAESYVTGNTRTGLDKPALVVSASYDEGKFERVRFGAVDNNAYAARDGEAGVARIDEMSMRAAMQAFDAVVIPPDTTKKNPEEKK
ncbi:MAG TPA: DUF4340 domain-containing protein [Vicinamibacterales bacterium]